MDALREQKFPNLRRGEYQETSPDDSDYNCIAWAVQINSQWWQPSGRVGHYWPPGFPLDDYSTTALIAVYQGLGFERCDTGDPESGYDKIAIYATPDGDYAHAARQLGDGRWTSKIGEWTDIEHNTVEALEGSYLGVVQVFLRRQANSED